MSNSSIIAVIACSVLEAEVRHFSRDFPNIRDLVFLPQGLHSEPARLQRELQAAVTRAEADPAIEAVVLVYGLCGRGIENLRHDRCPLVIPRAHDCVTLFLGSKERHSAYNRENPGTFWYNPGWISVHATPGPERDALLRREYTEKFGEDDVEYLLEMDREGLAHYKRAVYVGLGFGNPEKDLAYTRNCAACLGWGFDQVPGDPSLIMALLGGDWDEQRFLVAPPRHLIRITADETILRAEPEPSSHQHDPSP